MSAETANELRANLETRLVCDHVMQAMKRDLETLAHPTDPATFSRLMQLAIEYAGLIGMRVASDERRP